METHALVDTSPQSKKKKKLVFEGTKTDENLSHGVDDDKKSSQKHGELCKPGDIARLIQQSLV